MSLFNKLVFSLTLIFRVYSRDNSFLNLCIPTGGIGPFRPFSEIQVALSFARDYNEDNQTTNGRFQAYWDQTVTPDLISDFKKTWASHGIKAKVFASIGGRSRQYPFKYDEGQDIDRWVSNAVETLTDIVQTYNLDGIDVYYEHISASEYDFVYAIGELINKLKRKKTITVTSISPSPALKPPFYPRLFEAYGNSIDTVAYQLHNETEPIPDPQTLASRFRIEATDIYGKDKVLAGYSAIYEDWSKVKPIVYFFGAIDILGLFQSGYSAVGTSIWFVPPNSSSVPEASAREISAT